MANIEGTCREEFEAVREAFEYHLDSGIDIGASVAVFVDGEPPRGTRASCHKTVGLRSAALVRPSC
jgi:hypothetical protein